MGSVQWLWCSTCTRKKPVERSDSGFLSCTYCGKVLEDNIFSDEPSFVKNTAGQSQLAGNFVRTVQAESSASRERTLEKAYDFITQMADYLGVTGGDQVVRPAVRFYEIAVEKNFVRGRDSSLVRAACLYIACRDNNKPFLLIEFSEYLRVNVYVLGAVFLRLCKELHLEEHPIVQKPVDPSLFIHRFANSLLGEDNRDVELTALRIMTSMKLNWMQTGRKPSGLCGAALYISALSHGFKFSKTEIVKKVHICEATLTKRLIEFEGTESGGLTIEELNQRAKELENNDKGRNTNTNFGDSMSKEIELLCEHRGSGKPQFAHGLCETCYHEFISISGGLDGGAAPPAFQRAERARLAKPSANDKAADSLLESSSVDNSCKSLNVEKEPTIDAGGTTQITEAGFKASHEGIADANEESGMAGDIGIEGNELENLSDIDDEEVASYLHNEEEQCLKKIIWEDMNREYIQEQEAKAEAAAREAKLANFENGSKEMLDAKKLADAAAANYAKTRKGRQQKRAAEAKNALTAADAAHQMLSKKRSSTKLNRDRLTELFKEPVTSETPKKSQTESNIENNEVTKTSRIEAEEENEDELDNEYEGNGYKDYHDDSYYYNEDEYDTFDDGLF